MVGKVFLPKRTNMEQIENNQYRVPSKQLTPLRMTSSEIWMRQRANDVKIKNMTVKALILEMGKVQKEICLISGLKVDDGTAKEFIKLFIRFLLVHYSMLTCGEISLAFVLNASGKLGERVEYYGSILTLEHVGKVLSLYMAKRAALAKKLNENNSTEKELQPPTREQQEMDDMLFSNEYYRKYLSGEFSSVSYEYAHMVYDILDANKLIPYTIAEKNVFMGKAEKLRQQELTTPATGFNERRELNKLVEAYLNNLLPASEILLVKNYAKRLALFELFVLWKSQGRKRIFEL